MLLTNAQIYLLTLSAVSFIASLGLYFSGNFIKRKMSAHSTAAWLLVNFCIDVIKTPIAILLFIYSINFFAQFIFSLFKVNTKFNYIDSEYVLPILTSFTVFWMVLNFIRLGKVYLFKWANQSHNKLLQILLPSISNALQAVVFLLMINILLPVLGSFGVPTIALTKAAKVFLILTIGWVFNEVINALENIIKNQYINENNNFLMARKINTQVTLLKRIISMIGSVILFACILMVFDSVKNVGQGLLTTAGIISAVGAFASQQSLGRLFAGLQIAFSQPIRIGDTVIIDNEFGQVDEITLSYIVVKLWDLRQLILPSDYFTSRGLLNLTRNSTELLGTIFFYTDYSLPIEKFRQKFHELLSASKIWNKKVGVLQVTDIKEHTMEIRALVSADNSGLLWDLRCQLREALIGYILENYPDCLSKSRVEQVEIKKDKMLANKQESLYNA